MIENIFTSYILMSQQVQKMIEQFRKVTDIMTDSCPKHIQICVALHVRDTSEAARTEDTPDWYGEHYMAHNNASEYEFAMFKHLVNRHFQYMHTDLEE